MYARWITGMLLLALLITAAGCQGVGAYTGLPVSNDLPPAQQLAEPGPGVGGPGPGVFAPPFAVAPRRQPARVVQVMFGRPQGMQVRWDVSGVGKYDSDPLICPGRHNFQQGGMFGLKLTNIEGKEGAELYPTMELGPSTPRTAAYLSHNAVPIQFTPEDFDQVMAGNYVTKVIYLPDPEFQELAIAVDTLVSTRLDPGVDPIVEADRRGAILAIIRMGNIDKGAFPANGNGGNVEAIPTGFQSAVFAPTPMTPLPYSHGGNIPNYVSGVTAPYYGMPMTGTPIGLPGPPHIPHGFPAGLKRHQMTNHTRMYIPDPTKELQMHVQHAPGYSYPAPANRAYVKEETLLPRNSNRQPPGNQLFGVQPGGSSYHGAHPLGCGCPSCRAGH